MAVLIVALSVTLFLITDKKRNAKKYSDYDLTVWESVGFVPEGNPVETASGIYAHYDENGLLIYDVYLPVEEADSMLAAVGNVLAPLFKPVGLGDWRLVTSLICGFMAKESVVSVMGVLFGSGLISLISPLSVASMLVFCLLYTPCVAAIAAIRREMGGKWAVFAVIWQCALAWIAAFAVRLIGLLFGVG